MPNERGSFDCKTARENSEFDRRLRERTVVKKIFDMLMTQIIPKARNAYKSDICRMVVAQKTVDSH